MADVAVPRSAWLKPFIGLQALRAAMALLLAAGWVTLELYTVRADTAAKAADAAATARSDVESLIDRASAAAVQMQASEASPGNGGVALTARMLHLERGLQPARSLFLYDAKGRFVAATLPLLPGEDDVSRSPWFRAAARDPQPGVMIIIAGTHAPLSDGDGVMIARTIADRAGAFAGVAGTFVSWSAFRTLLSPDSLPPGTQVAVLDGADGAPVLRFSVAGNRAATWLDTALSWAGEARNVSATVALPGGFEWHATAGALAELSAAEERVILWGAPVIAAGLLAAFAPCRRTGSKADAQAPLARRAAPALEPDWLWELDAAGRLVGVGGNAPQPLIAAAGVNFLDLVAGDIRSSDLRDAIGRRAPLDNLELSLALPCAAGGSRRRILLNGRPVENTGGFWGTAVEVGAAPGSDRQARDS